MTESWNNYDSSLQEHNFYYHADKFQKYRRQADL